MKYIMFERKSSALTIRHPVIFPNHLVHSMVSEDLTQKGGALHNFKPVSAGDITFDMSGAHCHGSSSTLGLKSRSHIDERIINFNDYGAGMS